MTRRKTINEYYWLWPHSFCQYSHSLCITKSRGVTKSLDGVWYTLKLCDFEKRVPNESTTSQYTEYIVWYKQVRTWKYIYYTISLLCDISMSIYGFHLGVCNVYFCPTVMTNLPKSWCHLDTRSRDFQWHIMLCRCLPIMHCLYY